jgi:ATP-dependent helicase HrpA
VAKGKMRLMDVAQEICRIAGEILVEHQALRTKLSQPQYAAWPRALADIRAQLKELLAPGFLAIVAFERLKHYPRYIRRSQCVSTRSPPTPSATPTGSSNFARYWQGYQTKLVTDRARGVRDPSWRKCAGCWKSCGCRCGRSN